MLTRRWVGAPKKRRTEGGGAERERERERRERGTEGSSRDGQAPTARI